MQSDEYYLLINGETYGPFTLGEMRELWLQQEVPLDTLYIRKGMPEVRPLGEIINRVISHRESEPSSSPPVPTTPDRINLKMAVAICLLLVGLLVFLYGIKGIVLSPQDTLNLVKAEVQASPVQIKVTNNDLADWTDKLILLNDNVPGAYRYKIARLGAGKSMNVSLVSFSNDTGKHFEPWKQSVLVVWIGGNGHDFRRIVPARR
jgi:hypothetical protein